MNKLHLIIFILIAFSVYFIMHYVVYLNLAAGFHLSSSTKKFIKVVFLIVALSFPMAVFLHGRHLFRCFGMVWLGIISLAFSVCLLNGIIMFFGASDI